jgi:heptosyltransferase I
MTGCRILVVRLGAMGDIIHALPAVASLKQSFPGCKLSWAVESKWQYLLSRNPTVDDVIGVDRRGLGSWVALRRRLLASDFDFAVDFQGLIKSAIVASLARPDKIYGFDRSSVREKLASLVYSRSAKPASVHVVDRNLELAAAAGAKNSVRLFPLPQGEEEGTLLAGDFVLASPLAGWESKQWPLEHYAELARRLRAECGLVLVINGADRIDVPGAHSHASGLPGLVHATRRALAVIGVDSGPMHLAAALGKPGVAIFGPTDPARNGPYGESVTVLRSGTAATSYKRNPGIAPEMRAVTPEQVMSALKARITQAAKSR